jgi:hypothetical protein
MKFGRKVCANLRMIVEKERDEREREAKFKKEEERKKGILHRGR